MKCDISPAQVDEYQENGFVVINDFLHADELETWRACVDEAVENRGKRKLADGSMLEKDDYYSRVFAQRINLWTDHVGMRELMLDERLGSMAAQLADVDGIRIWHDQALIKPAWGNPTAWHLDNPYWSFYSRAAISIWVALDDVTRDNGCLYFLPGTHKTATYDNVGIGSNISDLFNAYPQWRGMSAVAVEMPAGSCSFHNGLVAHGAAANMTPYARRAITCAYMPDGSAFNGQRNILSQEQVESYQIGDVLDDELQNPLIYHRNKP
ncbi:MAG: phytanoyl-CoA dioxygenase family protein [Chloroflexi bacterium]|nr:phytanoyl-CoA dioxygenase family protein [Chloroflexota bacterium]MCY3582907.1 phytanoyl-CoA dioxygenase family protein [Chloroflexota bacterium]MCY3715659.1 phytanoyl-CoA dioxygenase family protein [Chloroflexota bacterium]MDE2650603.1 phytanoyl-CoA dioxygenase family protein [Chloroflexota bacterium]MXV93342.1 phytanoyl-CoA dioxygenase family protein [Chloroflexota bacterium]